MASAQVAAADIGLYTMELLGTGLGHIEDISTGSVLCDKISSSPKTCVIPYGLGSTINVRAVSGADSTFGGFSGNAQINGDELSDTITGNETIQATFNSSVKSKMNILLMTAIIIAADVGSN